MLIIEFIGVACAITGAWYMSKGFAVQDNAIKTFSFYLVSNVFFINLAIAEMMIPLLVQMLFFSAFAFNGIRTFAPELTDKVKSYLFLALIPTLLHLMLMIGTKPSLSISSIELVAGLSAVLGSYFLSLNKVQCRYMAFALFLTADTLYIAIGIENGLYFLAIQAGYFIYTSVKGIMQTRLQQKV
jgi:nicotinamide riboside transporter PnuC